MKIKHYKKEKGFTLVELLVSIAIFSIVLIVVMGAIVTIMDANRKARSLSLVMNNLDLAIESMTRSIKTGRYALDELGQNGYIDSEIETIDQYGDTVRYTFDKANNTITKKVGSDSATPIISPEIVIEDFRITSRNTGSQNQPMFTIRIKGKASVGPRTSSEFNIQTSVSQRNLNI